MDRHPLGASWSWLLGWLDRFAAHSDQTSCRLINGVATLKAVGYRNTCFPDKAPQNVFAKSWESRVIHQLVGTLAYAIALVLAVVQRAEKGLFLKCFQ
jgi:hypothetical protein